MSNSSKIKIEIQNSKGKQTVPLVSGPPKKQALQCKSCAFADHKKCGAYKAHNVLRLNLLYTLAQYNMCPMNYDSSSDDESSFKIINN